MNKIVGFCSDQIQQLGIIIILIQETELKI